MSYIDFIGKNGEFRFKNPDRYKNLCLPLANELGMKNSITPNLGGDGKLDQNSFILEPVSAENLHNNRGTRNFWVTITDEAGNKDNWSVTGVSAKEEWNRFIGNGEDSELTGGFMWQTVERKNREFELKSQVRSFVPLTDNVEVMEVVLENTGNKDLEITPVAAIPMYGRSADNIRDHRHVTSLLNRIFVTESAVVCRPTLSFDERGHQKNYRTYFVAGCSGEGERPVSFYPTVESFIGESGTYLAPDAIRDNAPGCKSGEIIAGKEAVGGLKFSNVKLAPGEKKSYTVLIGITDEMDEIESIETRYDNSEKVEKAYNAVCEYWSAKVNVGFETADNDWDQYMKWICFQPLLRRIYGCSFLPYHDYGRGGRGWRDLWQDCLSLLIMDPAGVRKMIVDNFGGVRIDGTNATIIGEKPGEFVADRNNIPRVWMDHGFWPFGTTKLYLEQTGDYSLLDEQIAYFKDAQAVRGTAKDDKWTDAEGMLQKDTNGDIYKGNVIEHLMLQNLCAFYEVGAHNIIRLRGADWNDALDMAPQNGESVAFTCAYAGNLADLADCIEEYAKITGNTKVELAKEIFMLMGQSRDFYDSVENKTALLKEYAELCKHAVSGEKVHADIEFIAGDLREKADWLKAHLRKQEWVEHDGTGWFNGYYDEHGDRVEGLKNGTVCMMLTSQVFAVMSGVASDEQIAKICESADRYLYVEGKAGYRLNTEFESDLGRMFGFAYGEKENGAVFSHMAVMYANALYKRGFVKEGDKVLSALMNTARDFETSKMYPGIPEYFDADGVGKYAYLTGAASWYMLTVIEEVYGIKGNNGDLVIEPKFTPAQIDETVTLEFADKKFEIEIINTDAAMYGNYKVKNASLDNELLEITSASSVKIARSVIEKLEKGLHKIRVELTR